MTNSLRLLLLVIAFFVAVQLAATGVLPAFPDPGFAVRPAGGGVVVLARVTPGSGAVQAGLHAGDEVIAIDGEPVRTVGDVFRWQRMEAAAGVPVRLTLRDGAQQREVTFTVGARPVGSLLPWIIVTILSLYFFTGFSLLRARWSDSTARWFGLAMTGVGCLDIERFFHMLWLAWMSHMGISLGNAAARLAWLLPAALLGLLPPGIGYCVYRFIRRMGSVELEPDWYDRAHLAVLAATGLAGFLVYGNQAWGWIGGWAGLHLIHLYEGLIGTLFVLTLGSAERVSQRLRGRITPTPRMIRQYRVLRSGTLVSFLPATPFLFVHLLWPHTWAERLAGLASLSVGLWPIFIAYSITRYRMFGLRRVMRKSLQYGLLSGGIGIFFLALTIALFWHAGSDAGHPVFLADMVLLSVVLLVGRLGSPKLHQMLDRRFFREAWTAEDILSRLGSQLGHFFQMEELQRYVLAQLDSALHLEWGAMYAFGGDGHGLRREMLAHSLTFDLPERIRVSGQDEALTAPVLIAHEEELVPVQRAWAGAEVVVPLRYQDRLLGWLLLGAKMSQEPYSRRDLKLLAAVGSQLAASVAGIHLLEEVRRRDRIQQEMQLAREVQMRLLPQRLPRLEGADIAATYSPAREVGGDFYDVFEIAPGRVAVILADVSGKGFSAALLMANLQAVVHGQHNAGSVSERLERMNEQLHRSVPSGQYVTMCYCEYDSRLQRLTYSNAGHEPPLLLRQEADGAVRARELTEGGTVLGLFPDSKYPCETVDLQPGDTLLMFTDGVTDAVNPQGERFERERLEQAARKLLGTGTAADRMVQQIREWVVEFAQGQAQFDDLTLLALQVAAEGQAVRAALPGGVEG